MKKSDEKTTFRILGLENSQPQNGAPFFLFFGGGVVRNLVKNHGVWEGKHYSLTHLPKKTMANLGSRWVVSHTYTWRQMASIAKPFGTHKRQSSHQTIASGFSWNQEDVHWNFHMLRPIPPFGPRCEKNPWTSSPSVSHDFPMPLTGSPLFNQGILSNPRHRHWSKKRSQGSFGCDRRSPCVILDHADITGYGRAKRSNVGTGSNEAFGLQTQTEKKTTEKSWKAPVPNAEDCNVVWTYLALSVT